MLRRDSSPDYSQEDIGEPILEVILQPGVCLILDHALKTSAYALTRKKRVSARLFAEREELGGRSLAQCKDQYLAPSHESGQYTPGLHDTKLSKRPKKPC